MLSATVSWLFYVETLLMYQCFGMCGNLKYHSDVKHHSFQTRLDRIQVTHSFSQAEKFRKTCQKVKHGEFVIEHSWWPEMNHRVYVSEYTLPKTHIESTNWCLEDYFPFGKAYFQGISGYVSFRECIFSDFADVLPLYRKKPPKNSRIFDLEIYGSWDRL